MQSSKSFSEKFVKKESVWFTCVGVKFAEQQNCTKILLFKGSLLHKGTKLHKDLLFEGYCPVQDIKRYPLTPWIPWCEPGPGPNILSVFFYCTINCIHFCTKTLLKEQTILHWLIFFIDFNFIF